MTNPPLHARYPERCRSWECAEEASKETNAGGSCRCCNRRHECDKGPETAGSAWRGEQLVPPTWWPTGTENGETGTFALEFLVSRSFLILVAILKDGLCAGILEAASRLLKCVCTVTEEDNSAALRKKPLLGQTWFLRAGQMSFPHMSTRWKHCSLTKLGLPRCSTQLSVITGWYKTRAHKCIVERAWALGLAEAVS